MMIMSRIERLETHVRNIHSFPHHIIFRLYDVGWYSSNALFGEPCRPFTVRFWAQGVIHSPSHAYICTCSEYSSLMSDSTIRRLILSLLRIQLRTIM